MKYCKCNYCVFSFEHNGISLKGIEPTQEMIENYVKCILCTHDFKPNEIKDYTELDKLFYGEDRQEKDMKEIREKAKNDYLFFVQEKEPSLEKKIKTLVGICKYLSSKGLKNGITYKQVHQKGTEFVELLNFYKKNKF